MIMQSARSKKIDQIKGIAILGVIYIHVSGAFGYVDSYLHDVTYALSRLAVPCFIVLFSYFFERKLIKDSHAIVYINRLYTLLIPFCFWSLLYFFITANLASVTLNQIKIITMYWSGYGWSGQYFFILLFQVILIFPVLRRLAENKTIRLLALLLTGVLFVLNTYFYHLVPEIITKISDRLIIYWVPYVLLGILMARIPLRGCKSKYFFLIVVLVPLEFFLCSMIDYTGSSYMRVSVLVVTYVMLPVLISLPGHIKGRLGSMLSLLGRYSMGLFVLNPAIILFLGKTKVFQFGFENQELNYIMFILVCLSVALVAFFSSLFIRSSSFNRII